MATIRKIIADIDAYMGHHGGRNADWYVGIAADPKDRLFNCHGVAEKGGAWIYRQADTSDIARDVEQAYVRSGHDGGQGGGDRSTVYVYAYLKDRGTNP